MATVWWSTVAYGESYRIDTGGGSSLEIKRQEREAEHSLRIMLLLKCVDIILRFPMRHGTTLPFTLTYAYCMSGICKVKYYLLTYLLTELSPSWEAASCATIQEIPSNFKGPEGSSPCSLVSILSQFDPVHVKYGLENECYRQDTLLLCNLFSTTMPPSEGKRLASR
jgi:hypothetical protein